MEFEDNEEYQKLRHNFEIRLSKLQNRLKTNIQNHSDMIEINVMNIMKVVKQTKDDNKQLHNNSFMT